MQEVYLDKETTLELLAALAEDNPHLRKATEQERIDLYEITGGNPLPAPFSTPRPRAMIRSNTSSATSWTPSRRAKPLCWPP